MIFFSSLFCFFETPTRSKNPEKKSSKKKLKKKKDTNSLPWTKGVSTTVALNDAQFANGAACGLCIMYQGTGEGLGTTPLGTGDRWYRGFVNNRCPECSHGDIDLNIAGDGRWKARWYAVPCNVGNTKLNYKVVVSSPYWFSLVVSNTAVPVSDVQIKLGGSWMSLRRSNNNQWAYYSEAGPWQASFPLPIRVTSVTGETVEDAMASSSGGDGKVQFKVTGDVGAPGTGYPGKGVPPQNLPNKGSVAPSSPSSSTSASKPTAAAPSTSASKPTAASSPSSSPAPSSSSPASSSLSNNGGGGAAGKVSVQSAVQTGGRKLLMASS